MKRNKLIGFSIAALFLGLVAFAIYSLFEIQPSIRVVPPSREARINEYLALDRWLEGQGIAVRIESSGNIHLISQARERRIFLQSSLFRWTDYTAEYLVKWIETGGILFLVLDYSQMWIEEEPLSLLERFGIKVEVENVRRTFFHDAEFPYYNSRVSFIVDAAHVKNAAHGEHAAHAAFTLKDRGGKVRLVQQYLGEGQLIVSGSPHFLLSAQLDQAANARLAWALFVDYAGYAGYAAESSTENTGWLFIRGNTRVQGLIGSLFRQGNFTVLLVSVFVLIFIGFWAVIPGFGLVKGDDEKPGKALRERFLAEGTFLKKHGALELYREVYMKEIKKRLAHKEGLDEKEIQNRIFELLGRPIDYRDFLKTIKDYQTILERI